MENLKPNPQNEEIIKDGQGVFVRRKTLYHGSYLIGIDKLNPAEETTVGEGVYFTSKPEDAEGYAIRRANLRKGEPVIYQTDIENLKFLDLRKEGNVKDILKDFAEILREERKKKELPWYFETIINQVIEKIDEGKVRVGNLREVTFSTGVFFTSYVKALGYDGLITIEGGEGNQVSDHDTFLVFDPQKIKNLSIKSM